MTRLMLTSLGVLLTLPVRAAVGNPDPNNATPPDQSLADFSMLVPAPAGRHGFLESRPDGHFYFADGTRARFWGINVSGPDIQQTDAVIEATVGRFRRAGINMLRLEAPDNVGCLLDTPVANSSRNINAAFLNRMHKWMAECRRNGLYVYLQLLDFRTFREGDGVPNAAALGRAAKPMAFFNRKLIELQKEYARQILLTPNPYTGLKPIKDPSVAVVELANEHGLFIKGDTWTKLPPPYGAEFRALWNAWLLKRYGSTSALDSAWTSSDGKKALGPGESLEEGTVQLPDMSATDRAARAKADWTDPLTSPARRDDGARFAYDLQTGYFREMKSYLRKLGLRIPITCVVSSWSAPDVKSVADTLDFTAENVYWDHPAFEPGKEWQKPFYYGNKDPLGTTGPWTMPPYSAVLKWHGKPVIVREWAAVWPNRYRASFVPLAAAYAAYLDLDGMLAFTYTFRGAKLNDFAWERDPTRWGQMGLAAALFHRRDVKPASAMVRIAWDDKALFTWQDTLTDLHRLAWVCALENAPAASPAADDVALTLDGGAEDPAAAMREALARLAGPRLTASADLSKLGVMRGFEVMGLDTGLAVFSVVSSRSIVFAGKLASLPHNLFPSFRTGTPYGVFWTTSLDGRPLAQTDRYLVKMVSVASNTDESFVASDGRYHPDRYALQSTGTPPIVTEGAPSDEATVYAQITEPGAAQYLAVGLRNGTWELMRLGTKGYFWCDTPDVKLKVPGVVAAIAHYADGSTQLLMVRETVFTYPAGALHVELRYVD